MVYSLYGLWSTYVAYFLMVYGFFILLFISDIWSIDVKYCFVFGNGSRRKWQQKTENGINKLLDPTVLNNLEEIDSWLHDLQELVYCSMLLLKTTFK